MMDWTEVRIVAVFVLCVATLLGGAVYLQYILEKLECQAQWRDSGMAYRYELLSGCMLMPEGRTWIPAKAYREVP